MIVCMQVGVPSVCVCLRTNVQLCLSVSMQVDMPCVGGWACKLPLCLSV